MYNTYLHSLLYFKVPRKSTIRLNTKKENVFLYSESQ